MNKYIDAEKLLKHKRYISLDRYEVECVVDVDKVLEAPAEDVVEVQHGKWVLERTPDGKPYCFHCSICDQDFSHVDIRTAYAYCPNCGAKMDA